MKRRRTPNPMQLAWQGAQLAWDAQQVIALRLTAFALNAPSAPAEASRMVTEKVAAALQAGQVAARAIGRGAPDAGAADIMRLYGKRVRANRRRLGAI